MLACPLTVAALEEAQSAIRAATPQPTVRRQLLSRVFEWLKRSAAADDAPWETPVWSGVMAVVLLGLTDVWSAIRKLSASRVFSLAGQTTPAQTRELYDALCSIATPDAATDSWRSLEGALLGMRAVIKRFRSVSSAVSPAEGASATVPFPDDLIANTRGVVFGLLSHAQLSVREASCRVLSALLTRSGDAEVQGMLAQAVARLRPDAATGTLLGAFEAEGVLRFCVVLVASPTMTATHLLAVWDDICAAFRPYLRHDASTSRQMASLIAQHVLAKANGATNSARRTELALKVLGSLVRHEELVVVAKEERDAAASAPASAPAAVGRPQRGGWQWQEGRLLAYELLVRYVLADLAICAAQNSRRSSPQPVPSPIVTSLLTPRNPNAALAQGSPVPSPSPRAPTAWSPQVVLRSSSHTRTHVMRTPMHLLKSGVPQTPPSTLGGLDRDGAPRALLDAIALVAPSDMAPAAMLWQMLVQTRECCAASQFELRRMGLQLVPLLTQALCCISIDVLTRFWGSVRRFVANDDRLSLRVVLLTMRAALCFIGGFDSTNPAFPATGVASADVVDMLALRAKFGVALPACADAVDALSSLVRRRRLFFQSILVTGIPTEYDSILTLTNLTNEHSRLNFFPPQRCWNRTPLTPHLSVCTSGGSTRRSRWRSRCCCTLSEASRWTLLDALRSAMQSLP